MGLTTEETYKILDDNGDEVNRQFIEKVDGDSKYTHIYSDEANAYMDSYDYYVEKENFSGGVTKRLNEVVLIFYDDYTSYNTYDIGATDEDTNRVENIGGTYGSKIFEKNDDGSYSPISGQPLRNNSKNKTYQYICSTNFINNVIGNYTATDGSIYSYDFLDFKIYIANKQIEKISYEFNLNFTDTEGNTTLYHYIGNGEFKNIGSTNIVVPTDPNEDIQIDERLIDLYNSIDPTNYSYEETFNIYDNNGNQVDFYSSDKKTITSGLYQEYIDDPYVQVNLYGSYDDKDDPSLYDCGLVKDYYYYGKFNVYNYFQIAEEGDGRDNSQNISGSYSYTTHGKYLKDYLKYFEYSRTNSKGVQLFNLKKTYLSRYGSLLIGSVSLNASLEFQNSLTLSLNLDGSAKISYEYYNYDSDGNKIGTIEGNGTYFNFGTTSVSIPNFNEELINNELEETINDFSSIEGLTTNEKLSIKNYKNYCNVDVLFNNHYPMFYYDDDIKEKPYFYTDDSICVSYENGSETINETIYKSLNADFSQINIDWFMLNGGLYYVSNDYLESFYSNVFGLSGEDYKFSSASIEITSNTITFTLSYLIRIQREDKSYDIFYINAVVSYSK